MADIVSRLRDMAVAVDARFDRAEARIAVLEAGPGGSGSWGAITGTLSDQADLVAALAAKADASTVTTALASKADAASTTTALAGKESSIAAGTTGQYWRGDKSWQTLDKAAVGLGNVDNTSDAAKNVLTATKLFTARTINGVSFDGSANITINAVDSTARLAASAVSAYGLTLIDDADAATARTTLGLGNVNNTSDANKPVSTATQTALDLKANLSGGNSLTGVQEITDGSAFIALEHRAKGTALGDYGAYTFADSTDTVIANIMGGADGDANLYIDANGIVFENLAETSQYMTLTPTTVAIKVSNVTRLNVSAAGAQVTGAITATTTITGSNLSGTNTGDQTSIVGITGTLAQFNTAITDADITPASRTISTTAPLTGGGDLSANRTLAISAATTSAAGSMSAEDKTRLDAMATPYRTITSSSGSHTAARVAGTYGFAQGQPLAISGTGTLYALDTIYIDPADYPAIGTLTAKLRIRCAVACNDVAPSGNYTIGLHPVTRPATSGGAGLAIYTLGAAVAGSTVAVNAPAADSHTNAVGADFALPAAGFYVVGMVSSATVAASAHMHFSALLQLHHA